MLIFFFQTYIPTFVWWTKPNHAICLSKRLCICFIIVSSSLKSSLMLYSVSIINKHEIVWNYHLFLSYVVPFHSSVKEKNVFYSRSLYSTETQFSSMSSIKLMNSNNHTCLYGYCAIYITTLYIFFTMSSIILKVVMPSAANVHDMMSMCIMKYKR